MTFAFHTTKYEDVMIAVITFDRRRSVLVQRYLSFVSINLSLNILNIVDIALQGTS